MSLSAIKKKVQGVVGRDAPTGHTLFKSWDAFENAVSLVWKNARIYNEDGSELYNLSLELEVCKQDACCDSFTNVIRKSSLENLRL